MCGDPMSGLPDRLVEFVGALRRHGVAVGPGETVDAGRVMTVLDLTRRDQFREGVAAAVLRRGGQRAVFDRLFDLYFPAATGTSRSSETAEAAGHGDVERLRDELAALLAAHGAGQEGAGQEGAGQEGAGQEGAHDAALRELAVRVLDELGAAPGPPAGPRWSAYQALDRLSPQTLLVTVLAELLGERSTGLAEDVTAREVRRRIEAFRRLVENEALRRTARQRGIDAVTRTAVPKPAEQIDLLTVRNDELSALRRTVAPLARKLATRLAARRRRHRRGEVDLRRTLRRSLATGGVPIRPIHRKPRPTRPELVVLCDVSSSVAGFSTFTLLLVQAMAEQFSRVRVFAFVDLIDEVTSLFAPGSDPASAMTRVFREASVIRQGRSDYGAVLGRFRDRWPDAVGPKTSVVLLGDARTNHADPNLDALRQLTPAARHISWLNPERRREWGTGDSAALRYARVVPMYECRTAAQLTEVIEQLLPV